MDTQQFMNLYSLYIQASGILAALISVIVLYRIEQIKNYLIGYGAYLCSRIPFYRRIHFIIQDIFEERLKGAVETKNILGVEEILIRLTAEECRLKPDINNRGQTGFYKQALPNWIITTKYLNSLRSQYFTTVILLIVIILLSIISIGINEICNEKWSYLFFLVISICVIIVLFLVIKLVYTSIKDKLKYEEGKVEEIDKLKKEYPEINKLY